MTTIVADNSVATTPAIRAGWDGLTVAIDAAMAIDPVATAKGQTTPGIRAAWDALNAAIDANR